MADPPPAEASHAAGPPEPAGPPGPPPTYAATQPQILVVPLPDASSFFWGRTLQGEVYVKGIGEARVRSVSKLTITPRLVDSLPSYPEESLLNISPQVLYPPESGMGSDMPFPVSHHFAVPLPSALDNGSTLPGTLDLASAGAVRWALDVVLTLASGQVIESSTVIEGIPPDVTDSEPTKRSGEAALERGGVRTRVLVDDVRPRLGAALRLGVEVKPLARAKTTVAGLASQPDPAVSLRGLRRVRVELVRIVDVSPPEGRPYSRSTTLHYSGKGLRYPGRDRALRVLFHLPTHAPGVRDAVTAHTPYHRVRFVIRAQLGFAAAGPGTAPGQAASAAGPSTAGTSASAAEEGDWTVELDLEIRPTLWTEPETVTIERGLQPELGAADPRGERDDREAYRRKGLDVVGEGGTTRAGDEGADADAPPPFDAGPSTLPSFNESEAAALAGQAPVAPGVPSERLVPVSHSEGEVPTEGASADEPGELDTWVEYDGYETFSEAPPPLAASFGVEGSMDPPREGDPRPGAVAGDMAARLGLSLSSSDARSPAQLMQQLGLERRVIDMHDDLPPGIDEPSLPALPGFNFPNDGYAPPPPAQDYAHAPRESAEGYAENYAFGGYEEQTHAAYAPGAEGQRPPDMRLSPALAPLNLDEHPPPSFEHPPSFDASEAADAAGVPARSTNVPNDQPPGYFGSAPSGGPPAYS